MPIYEYQCTNCGCNFEVMQKITDEPLRECRHCAGKLQRLISLTNFQLKGSGWYVTDYKNKNETGKRSAEKGEEGKVEKKSPNQG